MLKAILISISFAVCGYTLHPYPPHNVVTKSHNQYSLYNTDFTINGNDPQLVRQVATKVLPMKRAIIKKWLDGPIPVGMRHITINVFIRSYNRAYCTMTDHPNIYIYSKGDHLYETLKHELTHALLSIRYPDLPRWTHEGVASSWDGPGHQKMYQRILRWSRKSGTYPRLREVMKGFNGHNQTAYTASNSLVKFLLTQGSRYDLFLYATNKCTLQRAYGYSSTAALQQAWVNWLNAPCVAIKPSG